MPKTFACKVPKCDYRSTSSIGLSLLQTTNPVAMKSRADAVGLLVEDVKVTHRICHKHFLDSDFFYGDNNFKKLRPDAEPSKFLVSSFTTRILHIFSIVLLQFTSNTTLMKCSKPHRLKITKKVPFHFFFH